MWCDNKAVVDILGRNKTRDVELGAILRDIHMLQASYNIQVTFKHVRGESNPVVDALSRVHRNKSIQGYQEYTVPRGAFVLNLVL